MLYMFQAVPPPIIRCSKTVYTASGTLSKLFYYLPRQWQVAEKVWQSTRCGIYSFWAPDDGRRNRLKHVEHFTEINNLCNVASCWLYLKIRLRCTDQWTPNDYSLQRVLKHDRSMGILGVPQLHIWHLRPFGCGAASLERCPRPRDGTEASSLGVEIVIKNEEHIVSFTFRHIYGLFHNAVSSSYYVP
jgi:hypothetical protein